MSVVRPEQQSRPSRLLMTLTLVDLPPMSQRLAARPQVRAPSCSLGSWCRYTRCIVATQRGADTVNSRALFDSAAGKSTATVNPFATNITRTSPATVVWLHDNYEAAEGVSLGRSTLYQVRDTLWLPSPPPLLPLLVSTSSCL